MSQRILLVSSDDALAGTVKAALQTAASLMRIDRMDADSHVLGQFQPSLIVVDSEARNGVQTAFERITEARQRFPDLPIVAAGNEMSAQLVLAALRAGANDFVDRDSGDEQMRRVILSALTGRAEPVRANGTSKIVGVLSSMPSDLDQDFCLNLALRAAKHAPQSEVLYIDLSLPATQADIALGVEMKFGLLDAIREMNRLDKALLASAVARDPRCGLHVMPLACDARSASASLDADGFSALLQILRNVFDTIIIGYGPFSHQRRLLETSPAANLLLCCNQRFSSIRAAKQILDQLKDIALPAPMVVIHEMAPGIVPDPAEIFRALNVTPGMKLGANWDELLPRFNGAEPPALSDSSRYARTLDECLARLEIAAPVARTRSRAGFLDWLRIHPEARAT